MNPLSGFITFSPLSGINTEKGGIFFLEATVRPGTKPGFILLETRYGLVEARTDLSLSIGAQVKLQLIHKADSQLVFKIISQNHLTHSVQTPPLTHLMSTLLSRGLPLLDEKIKRIELIQKRLGQSSAAITEWLVNMEAKELTSDSTVDLFIPIMEWESQVRQGLCPAFPCVDPEIWDLWNLKKDKSGQQWISFPFSFTFYNQEFQALVHALIDPVWNGPRFWGITSQALDIPLQIKVSKQKKDLNIVLTFFKDEDYIFYAKHDILLPEDCTLLIKRASNGEKSPVGSIDERC